MMIGKKENRSDRVRKMVNKALALFTLLFLAMSRLSAQPAVEMADQFRADGKIRVVVGVIAIIFIGIVVFMVTVERRIAKLEKLDSE